MKCLCMKRCQVRNDDGRAVRHNQGEVVEFSKCPTHFQPLEAEKINFDTASEDELMEGKYKLDDLKAFLFDKYDKKAGMKGKNKTVALLIDCRYRAVDKTLKDIE